MWPLFTENWGSWRSDSLNLSPCPFTDPVTGLPTLHEWSSSPLLMYGFSKEVVECPANHNMRGNFVMSQPTASIVSSLNSSSDLGSGFREPDNVKFTSVKGGKMASSSRRIKKKWQSREERRFDGEYDIVLVPSDGGCLSGSESDDSDWSIGWSEPHAPDFQSDDETENSFAVLVPCYRHGHKELRENSKNQLLSALGNLQNEYSAESKKYMEQWLSSLQSG